MEIQIQDEEDKKAADEIRRRFTEQVLDKLPATLQSYFHQQPRT